MKFNRKEIIFFVLFLISIIISQLGLAYKVEVDTTPVTPVHQYISNESQFVWNQIPYEIKQHLQRPLTYPLDDDGYGPEFEEDIIVGSGEEDKEDVYNCLYYPLDKPFCYHFFDPDDPDAKWDFNPTDYNKGWTNDVAPGLPYPLFWNFGSSYRRAKEIWKEKVIPLYNTGKERDKDEAYYWLGRIAHLLEDATSPPHTHDDTHIPIIDPSYIEEYTADNYTDYEGSDYNSDGPYFYESPPNTENLNWNNIDPRDRDVIDPGQRELFRLFWYTAQKTQYQASRDADGNSIYYDLNENPQSFSTSLWQGDNVDIISNQGEVQANVKNISDAVMPHAMRAVSGLYRLFEDAVQIDWPMFHHDLRRTGFRLLKVDLDSNDIDWASFIIDDIDNTLIGGLME